MSEFDISWVAIGKLMLAGFATYVLLPAALVVRDLFLHKAINKLILTGSLISLIRMCENDRWFLNNKYNKSVSVAYKQTGNIYKIGDEEVAKEEFKKYESGRKFHSDRYESANSKIALKHNLIVWLTKHYKQADGGNPIPGLRKRHYESAGGMQDERA